MIPKYLYFCLLSPYFQQIVQSRLEGATTPHLYQRDIVTFPVFLPPLDEQKRIVAVLDEAFEGLSRARANAEANLADVRELFRSALREVFENGSTKWATELPAEQLSRIERRASGNVTQTGGREATLRPILGQYSLAVLDPSLRARQGWRWTPLTSLARLESGHTPSRRHPEYWGGNVPWMGIKDARDHHGRKIYETLEQTNALGIENSSARILPINTVCLSRTASVGYVTVMGHEMATSQDFVNWVCGEALLPDFLMFLLLAQGDDIRKFASGSVHQTIYFPEVKAFHICHPPIAIQREICHTLSVVKDAIQPVITDCETKLSHLDTLRQSLLQKAFSGELT